MKVGMRISTCAADAPQGRLDWLRFEEVPRKLFERSGKIDGNIG